MYGLVNKAIEEMVRTAYGATAWAAVKRRAAVSQEVFISTEIYPDDITYRLVDAVSDCTGISATEVLQRFGEHWVLHTGQAHYGHLFVAAGPTIGQFFAHLPRFHDRVALLFPDLMPPHFEVTDQSPRSVRLHYRSARPGLTPLVAGMIAGIGRRFDARLEVTLEHTTAETGGNSAVFLVQW